ncbi:MAG: histidine kinase N-terminal 7TM domain-containing protein [Pseudomonas sp.]|uniref:histidine kinase N-terminal 7TM domain-containing diguanylate cyclase n=1 Tax=Pseudomonas sp. TaxID=306 RepID=UPI0030F11338
MNLCSNSGWALSMPVVFTVLVCIGVLMLAHWVTRQRGFPGRDSFFLLHMASFWWLVAASLEMAAQSSECKMFWASMAWPGIVGLPTFWAVFLWQYVNSERKPLPLSQVAVFAVVPVVVWLLALSNPWHGLFYTPETAPLNAEPGAPLLYRHGPLFYATAIYEYAFVLFCLAVVIKAAVLSRGVHRRHYLAFVLVTLLPWGANLSYVFWDVQLFGFDPTPFCFAFTLLAFSWLIVGVRLFDLLPVARHLLLQELLDPVLVVDTQQRLLEANPAACRLANQREFQQGVALGEWPVYGAALQAVLQQPATVGNDRLLTLEDPPRYFEVSCRAIERATRSGSSLLGQMLYLRDVTQRHLSERTLADALALSEDRLRTISSLHERLQEQALRDPLTGLYNRRYLDEFFDRELARAQREQKPLALALIDLDHFKALNDAHGHLVGDDVLVLVAQLLTDALRSTDAVFRIGGEEFLLILPGVGPEEARQRLERICLELAITPVGTRNGPQSVTLSAGLACWPAQGEFLEDLLQIADAALYEAKRSGRNRVCGMHTASL